MLKRNEKIRLAMLLALTVSAAACGGAVGKDDLNAATASIKDAVAPMGVNTTEKACTSAETSCKAAETAAKNEETACKSAETACKSPAATAMTTTRCQA